jgi:alkanesulfonate monooxygenase SsuD/methylene tetrahydromethanopterin reductase-like flavin-dependent oxidoreductase (luciferase family)
MPKESAKNKFSMPRFAFYLVEPVGLEDALEFGTKAEENGYDAVAACENLFWWSPGQSPVWDNFVVLNTILQRTKRIKILTDVIDPVKRHPAVVAQTVATIDSISKNRIALGIGAGEVANFGPMIDLAKPPSLSMIKEFIQVIRGLWGSTVEKPLTFEGKFYQLKDAYLSTKPYTKPNPPIYIGAMGPKMRKLVGELGDGWVPLTYTPESYQKDLEGIQEVARSCGRDPNAIDHALTVYTITLRDRRRAEKIATERGRLELVARPELLPALGYGDLADYSLTWAKRSGPLVQSEREKQLMKAIPESEATRVTISGTPDDAIERIEEFVDAGVQLFILWQPYENRKDLVETIKNYKTKVLPYFARKRRK